MYQPRDYETVNMILKNPTFWNKSMMKKTLHTFEKGNSKGRRAYNTSDVQELIRNYLHTLLDVMKNAQDVKKIKTDVRSLSDFTLPEWVR